MAPQHRLAVTLLETFQALELALLRRERHHHAHARDGLRDMRRDRRVRLAHTAVRGVSVAVEEPRHRPHHGHGDEHPDRQVGEPEGHLHEAERHAEEEAHEDDRAPEHDVLERVHVAVGPGDDPPLLRAVEVAHAEALDVVEHVLAHVVQHLDADRRHRAELPHGDPRAEHDVRESPQRETRDADDVGARQRSFDRLADQPHVHEHARDPHDLGQQRERDASAVRHDVAEQTAEARTRERHARELLFQRHLVVAHVRAPTAPAAPVSCWCRWISR